MDTSFYYGEDTKTPGPDTKETKRFDMEEIPSFMITDADTDLSTERGREAEGSQKSASPRYNSSLGPQSSGRKFSLQLGKLFHRRKSSTPNIPEVRRHSNVEASWRRGQEPQEDLAGSGKRRGSTFEYMSEATGL